MDSPEILEEFKQILEFAIQRGNEETGITLEEFVRDLARQLRPLFEKTNT